jgi:hypothetical protein
MTERKLHLYCCVAGAYSAALLLAFYDRAVHKFIALATDFSWGAVWAVLGLPIDLLIAGFAAIPMAVLGLMAGVPGMAGGYAAAAKLRARGIDGLWPWLGAGACIGAVNAALVLLLIPEREAGMVMGSMMMAAAFTAYYLRRTDRERAFLNR